MFRAQRTPITASVGTFTPAPEAAPAKVKPILSWLARRDRPLKKIICGIATKGTELEFSQMAFTAPPVRQNFTIG